MAVRVFKENTLRREIMSSTTMHPNGETRKSLASQIDRLDAMLDNLAEGINDTVVDAVKEAVGQAVREAVQVAITEVLTNTVLQRHLRSAAAPASEPAAPGSKGVVHGVRRACDWLTGVAKGACRSTWAAVRWLCSTTKGIARQSVLTVQDCGRRVCRRVQARARGIWQRALLLSRRACTVAVVALGVALILGIVAFTEGPFLTSLLNTFVTQVLVLATLLQRPVLKNTDTTPGKVAA